MFESKQQLPFHVGHFELNSTPKMEQSQNVKNNGVTSDSQQLTFEVCEILNAFCHMSSKYMYIYKRYTDLNALDLK